MLECACHHAGIHGPFYSKKSMSSVGMPFSDTVLASHAQSPGFNLQHLREKKKTPYEINVHA
jgi:hypothetical protein